MMIKKVLAIFYLVSLFIFIIITPAECCETEGLRTTSISVPSVNSFKSYMSYKVINKKTSEQYKLQQQCITDEMGLRTFNGRYVIAVGTGVGGHIGTNIDLVLENGIIIPCVIGDYKAIKDTDSTNLFSNTNNCCSEFIVDINVLYDKAKRTGDISKCYENWNGKVVEIKRY